MENLSHSHDDIFEMDLSTGVYAFETVLPHFHQNYELLIALSGSSSVTVGGNSYELSEGDAVFICPFQIHGFKANENS